MGETKGERARRSNQVSLRNDERYLRSSDIEKIYWRQRDTYSPTDVKLVMIASWMEMGNWERNLISRITWSRVLW